jgi:U3 small nucleolar RNA-associated protein 4
MTSFVLVVDLSNTESGPKVLRRFDHHRRSQFSGREVKLAPTSFQDDEDVEMENVATDGENEEQDGDGDKITASVYIQHIAISADGQWLVTSDERSRTHIFNLDSMQVRSLTIISPAITCVLIPNLVL